MRGRKRGRGSVGTEREQRGVVCEENEHQSARGREPERERKNDREEREKGKTAFKKHTQGSGREEQGAAALTS